MDVAVGKNHTLFLSKYGRVFTSGDNTHGQLGRITTAGWNPQQVSNTIGSNITSIAAGEYHSACLVGTTIYTWGRNDKGQLAHNYSGSTPYKVMPSNVLNAKAVVCGANHTVALDSDGYLWSAGDNTYGQCGGLYAYYWQSTQGASVSTYAGSTFTKRPAGTVSEGAQGSPPDPTYETYDSIACGDDFTVARKGEQIYTFGDNRFCQLGRISNSWGSYNSAYQSRNIAGDCQGAILPAQSSTRFADVVCGSRHALARTNNGRLHSWGDNDCGQLCRSASTGNASTVNSGLVMDEAVSLIAAGGDHSGFVKEIGELWTAGKNLSGQLCRTGPTGTGSSPNLEKVM